MMKSILAKIKKYRLGIITGVLIGTSYIPAPPWAIFFGYIPLWLYITSTEKQLKLSEIWWTAWVAQFVMTFIGFNWVAYLVKEFAFIGLDPKYQILFWIVGFVCQLLFCSLIHLYIPLAASLGALLQRKFQLSQRLALATQAILLGLFERLWPSIFPWNLGYTTLWARWPLAQWADVFGFSGLSMLILISNALLGIQFLDWKRAHRSPYSFKILLGLLFFWSTLQLTGARRALPWQNSSPVLTVAMVQGNIGNSDKVYAEKGLGYQDFILEKFLNLSDQGLHNTGTPQVDLLMWPETAYPDYLTTEDLWNRHQNQLAQFLKRANVTLLTGAFAREPIDFLYGQAKPKRKIYNSLFLIASDGRFITPPYHKTYLVAFSEYFPLSDFLPFVLDLPFVSNFGRGPGPSLMTLPLRDGQFVQLGAQICYEGLYSEFSRRLVEKGAEIFVNVTNDSWFGSWAEPYQHLTMTVAKSIEMRRPLLRSTNTGITTASLADGSLLEQSPIEKEWFGTFSVPYQKSPPLTIYTQYGHLDWIFWILVLLVGLLYSKHRNALNDFREPSNHLKQESGRN